VGARPRQTRRQRVVEKLVVGRPPEGIVDDHRAIQRRMFHESTIKRDIVRDAVHDHRVARHLIEVHGAGLHKLCLNAVDVARIDALNERAGKAVFHSKQDADSFMRLTLLLKPLECKPETN